MDVLVVIIISQIGTFGHMGVGMYYVIILYAFVCT